MARLFLDCEYNGFRGRLISMALVPESLQYPPFYEVLECPNPCEWVQEHVIPVLHRAPVSYTTFQNQLSRFLLQWAGSGVEIVADWYEDVEHFCRVVQTDPGNCLPLPPMKFEIVRDLDDCPEEPHNALSDARAIREAYRHIRCVHEGNHGHI